MRGLKASNMKNPSLSTSWCKISNAYYAYFKRSCIFYSIFSTPCSSTVNRIFFVKDYLKTSTAMKRERMKTTEYDEKIYEILTKIWLMICFSVHLLWNQDLFLSGSTNSLKIGLNGLYFIRTIDARSAACLSNIFYLSSYNSFRCLSSSISSSEFSGSATSLKVSWMTFISLFIALYIF